VSTLVTPCSHSNLTHSLTFPKSSAVSRYLPEGERSHELTSVPSDSGGQMPMTGNPRTHVQVDHLNGGGEGEVCKQAGWQAGRVQALLATLSSQHMQPPE
jgi:hypothetical protein